ncbi:hypothetical protein ACSBR1_015132 [Camellia fascicularis]
MRLSSARLIYQSRIASIACLRLLEKFPIVVMRRVGCESFDPAVFYSMRISISIMRFQPLHHHQPHQNQIYHRPLD